MKIRYVTHLDSELPGTYRAVTVEADSYTVTYGPGEEWPTNPRSGVKDFLFGPAPAWAYLVFGPTTSLLLAFLWDRWSRRRKAKR
jgi:hypothetical protein